MAALDNANPTILSASQLPTRQKRTAARHGPESKYLDLIFDQPSYLARPFCLDEGIAWPKPESRRDDEFGADPIDEQEIYGMATPSTELQLRDQGN